MKIAKLRVIMSRSEKIYLLLLVVMSIVFSIIETVGVGVIMPFITLATSPDLITSNQYSSKIYNFFNFSSTTNFMIAFGVLLIIFYIFRAIYTMFYHYALNRFAFGRYHLFAFRLFKNYTNLPYKEFVKRNSSVMTKTIVNEAVNLTYYVQNMLMLFSEIFTIVLLYIALLFVNLKMTLVLTVLLGINVFLIRKSMKKTIKKQGEKRSHLQSKFYKILGETFGNFKLIKIIQNEKKLYDEFSQANYGFAKANIINNTLVQLPRVTLETIGFGVLISIVVYILFKYNDANFVLPIISMYALALYRILPAVSKIMASLNNMNFYAKSVDIVYNDLNYYPPIEGGREIAFNNNIVLKEISFEYIEGKKVLNNINLTIDRGSKVAFVGKSGSGKSTLVDLIIGLYRPNSGEIFIDGEKLTDENVRSFRSKVGYIPQQIYLFDDTVANNVAFGYEYDEAKIIEVLKKANIYDFFMEKDGIDTIVGEGGIQLSGGQKQRVGIARALYSDPEILVLDEATSALDSETEAKIMDEIYDASGDKTLLIIAHRLSTVERCEVKIQMQNGEIIA